MDKNITLKFLSPNTSSFSHYIRFLSVLIKLHQEFEECLEIESPLIAADDQQSENESQSAETESAAEKTTAGLGNRILPWVRKYVPADRSRQNPLTRRFNSWLDKFEPEADPFHEENESQGISGQYAILHLQYEGELVFALQDLAKIGTSTNPQKNKFSGQHFTANSDNGVSPAQDPPVDNEEASETMADFFEDEAGEDLDESLPEATDTPAFDETTEDHPDEISPVKFQVDDSMEHLVLILDDSIISGQSESPLYREKLMGIVNRLEKSDHHLATLKSLHLLFMGKKIPEGRQVQLSQIPLPNPTHPYRFQRSIREYGLQALHAFNVDLHNLLREKIALNRISCSFIYTGNIYPESGPEMFSGAFSHIISHAANLTDPLSFYQSLINGIKSSTLKTDYYADLQITLLGQEKKHDVFKAVSRNLCERWPVRHQMFSTENIALALEADETSALIRIDRQGISEEPTYIHIAEVSDQHSNQNLSHFGIGSYRIHSRQDMIIWIIPGDWFDPVYDKNVVQSPINQELIIIGQLVEALSEIEDAHPPILHVFETAEIKTDYNIRPWPLFTPDNDPIAADAVNRRVPRIYHLITSTIADVRFHLIPWSYNGSHLDFAPGWIDRMVCDGLNWNPDFIGEANWNDRI